MIRQALNDGWTLNISGERDSIPAKVPGSCCADLIRAGRMEDPLRRGSTADVLALMERSFTYTCRFTPNDGLLDCPELLLRFEGIDGPADITLNGTPLDHVENAHRTWEYPVECLVHKGVNTLTVELKSPARHIGGVNSGVPRLLNAGIWRPVTLAGTGAQDARILDAYISQTHEDGRVRLDLGVSYRESGTEFAATLTEPDGNIRSFPGGAPLMSLTIDDPQLWWPRGYGSQPLYTVTLTAKQNGRTADTWERRIGLRMAGMSIRRDQYGESFAHEINGVKIFAMGAGFGPGDGILARMTPQRTRRLLEDAAAANFNCIRVSGGFYPGDHFYDICDEMGLLVWQDFMFTPAVYGLTPESAADIRAEVRDIVTRLRHHPCIALWCGSDGLELSARELTPRQKADHIRVFEYIIPTELKKLAPEAFYWPSSPSSGGGFDRPDSLEYGDVHPDPTGSGDPGRYVSAFGTPSCPSLSTLEIFTLPRDRNLFSQTMEEHSECPDDTACIMANIQRHYLYPTSFEALIYASQLAQAEDLRSAAQHYRRHRGRCMGALFRRLNDPWPQLSCSSIDFYGRWKALHYFARRFFAPLLLSCEGPERPDNALRLCVVNDTPSPRSVLIKLALRDGRSRIKREETVSLTVPALHSAWLDRVTLPEADISTDFVSYTLYEKSVPVSFGTELFVPAKYYRFQDPRLECRLDGDEIVVSSAAFAKSVEIRNAGEDIVLSDNYFDMLPGERRVRILRGKPDNLRVRSVYDIK